MLRGKLWTTPILGDDCYDRRFFPETRQPPQKTHHSTPPFPPFVQAGCSTCSCQSFIIARLWIWESLFPVIFLCPPPSLLYLVRFVWSTTTRRLGMWNIANYQVCEVSDLALFCARTGNSNLHGYAATNAHCHCITCTVVLPRPSVCLSASAQTNTRDYFSWCFG